MELICYCGTKFRVPKCRIETAKYCSILCGNRKKSADYDRTGSNNPGWKGHKVGKQAMHGWMLRNWTKTNICEHCHKEKKTDWANKTGKYIRGDRKDWLELCRSCHTSYDVKVKYLHNNPKQRHDSIKPRKCLWCSKEYIRHAGHITQKYCSRYCYMKDRYAT